MTKPLRVLITNNTLDARAGTELYVRDLAIALLRRGHAPVAYSPVLGAVAEDLRAATVPVVSDLNQLADRPDVIHGQHHLETMTALLHFPGVPAAYFCHGWKPWQESPPRSPRILRYVAVDNTCRDRLTSESGISGDQVRVILNFVDLKRFAPRALLPARPRRALMFSNAAREGPVLKTVRETCSAMGLVLDVVGSSNNTAVTDPERQLVHYDVVFAKARAALEAMAVGAATILHDVTSLGPLVTTANFDGLRPFNFGIRTIQEPFTAEALRERLSAYDPEDAAKVSVRVRAEAGLEDALDKILALYGEVLSEPAPSGPAADLAERRATADYVKRLSCLFKQREQDQKARALLQQRLDEMKGELAMLRGSRIFRLREWILRSSMLRRVLLGCSRLFRLKAGE